MAGQARALAVMVVAALAAQASADGSGPTPDPLDEARALEGSLDYERALVIVDREIARGAATTPARLVELHLLAGTLAAGLDHPDLAEVHFAKALALAPYTRLPDGTSPKITAPFEAARATTVPLKVAFAIAGGGAVTATTGPDPAHVFGGVRGDDAIDEYGNVIAHRAVDAVAAPPRSRAPAAPAPATPPLYARWATWAIAAGGAAAIGGACAWRFEAAQDQWNSFEAAGGHDYSQLVAIEARGRDWGWAADAAFGGAAAAAITAVVMAVARRGPPAIGIAASGDSIRLAIAF